MRWVFAALALAAVRSDVRADEADDRLARELAEVVRDPRLRVAQRIEAARLIGNLGMRAGAAVPALSAQLTRLRGTELETLQEAVIDTLGRIGSPAKAALPALAKAAGRSIDIDLAIRRSNNLILASSDSQDVGALTRQLQSSDSSVRLRAVKALGNLGPAARFAYPDLVTTVTDRDPDVRRAAVQALITISPETPLAEQVVRAIAVDLRDPDAGIRLLAIRALARLGRRAGIVVAELEQLLTDPDPDVRRAAADAMGRIAP